MGDFGVVGVNDVSDAREYTPALVTVIMIRSGSANGRRTPRCA